MTYPRCLLTGIVAALSPASVLAQPAIGDPFTVNSYTTAIQASPRGCTTAAGQFVVTWNEPGSYAYGAEGRNGSGLFARRVSGGGVPLGTDFAVNTYTTGTQSTPTPACLDGGRFVVAHADTTSYDYVNGIQGRNGLFATIFEADGAAAGAEFRVDDTGQYESVPSQLAACKNGTDEFVVVWSGANSEVGVRRFDSDGQPFGASTSIAAQSGAPAGATCCGGPEGFVVAWADVSESGYGGYSYFEVFAQRFSTTGAKLGSAFQVNTDTELNQSGPSIGCSEDGSFVVAWESGTYGFYSPKPPPDGFGTGVFAQRFDAQGDPVGAEFLVNTSTTSNEGRPRAAADAAGNFLIVWNVRNSAGGTIRGQAFDASGAKIGTEFGTLGGDQNVDPAAMAAGTGKFLMVWQHYLLGTDTDDIRGQIVSLNDSPTTTTTSTTMGGGGVCGDPVDAGAFRSRAIAASDALFVLKAAVGTEQCAACVCDVDNNGVVSASDALLVLKAAVGQPVVLNCPAC